MLTDWSAQQLNHVWFLGDWIAYGCALVYKHCFLYCVRTLMQLVGWWRETKGRGAQRDNKQVKMQTV